ncbi:MAG: T9SS type A sorting domain-containing protein [Bacteroidota bacterium]
MRSTNLQLTFLLFFAFGMTLGLQAQDNGNSGPGPNGPGDPGDHVVVKGSSTRGFTSEDCGELRNSPTGEGELVDLGLTISIANLVTFTGIDGSEIYSLPFGCPSLYVELYKDQALIASEGPFRTFDFYEMYNPYEEEEGHVHDDSGLETPEPYSPDQPNIDQFLTPLYTRDVDFEIDASWFCEEGTGPFSQEHNITVRLVDANGNSYRNIGGACNTSELFPKAIFDDAENEYIPLTIHICCRIGGEGEATDQGGKDRNANWGNNIKLNNDSFQFQVNPNPFQTVINLNVESSTEEMAVLRLFDAKGQKVREWTFGALQAGQQLSLDGATLAKGLYIGQLQIGSQVDNFKILKQ